jgi:hypothetical protein
MKIDIRREEGTTLIETAIACGLLMVVMGGLLGITTTATTLTENQGHLGARVTEYAVDKMEQLLDLTYGDAQSDTTAFPTANAGGTGLAVGGSANPNAPVTGYTDYLKADGTLLCPCGGAAPSGWFYKRVWQVTTPSAHLKQVTVVVTVSNGTGGALKPASTISAFKTDCPSGC